jgi:Tfp pilus assembly protein PilX
MKIQPAQHRPARRPERGSAVVVILALLAILVLLVAANTQTVRWARAEVRLVDQRQTARLAAGAANPAAGMTSTNRPDQNRSNP